MYRVLHTGFDTLDVSYQGALPAETLKELEIAQIEAKQRKQDVPVIIGPGNVQALLKPHGQRGGYAFVLTNGPTGAIFTFMNNPEVKNWNIGVSVRALRLLTHGYEKTKSWIKETLDDLGCKTIDHSVRRIDFAIDVLAPSFKLEINNFITPGRTKMACHWSPEHLLDDDGNRPHAVISNRNFESATIGRQPGRQICFYDKRRAAIDLQQPYWFDVWGVKRDDPGARVFRIEVRAGRDALAKRLIKRSFAAVEADIAKFIDRALTDIRYVTDIDQHKNISRSTVHPIWDLARHQCSEITFDPTPVLPEPHVLEIMRLQRLDMALKQAAGNILNSLVLAGHSPNYIAEEFKALATRQIAALTGSSDKGLIEAKAESIAERVAPLICRTRP